MTKFTIIDLIQEFNEYLHTRKSILNCFSKYGIQVEGWFKGELLAYLDKKLQEGSIVGVDREISFSTDINNRKKIDLKITLDDNGVKIENWFELKHWLIGNQKGYKYNANFYFKDAQLGIKKDVDKLSENNQGRKMLLIFCTVNPGIEDWNSGVNAFNSKFNFNLISLNSPSNFSDSFFLGILELV